MVLGGETGVPVFERCAGIHHIQVCDAYGHDKPKRRHSVSGHVPVVPVHLAGIGRILPKGKNRPRPSHTVVTFGTPLLATDGERSQAFADRIEHAVAALADEATSDWYSARRRAAAGETPSLSAPQSGVWRRAWAVSGLREKPRGAPKSWPDLG